MRRARPCPLIGFAGAPFTVASYLVEGGPSRTYARTKALMHGDPALWRELLDRLADLALASLRSQVEAGRRRPSSSSTAGPARSRPADYERFVLPAQSARCSAGVADLGVPRIHFGVGTGELLGLMAEAGADVVGVDWRVPLDDGPPPRRRRRRRCRATSTRRSCLAAGRRRSSRRSATSSPQRRATPATSSTSATACCPRPTRPCSGRVVELVHGWEPSR